MTWHCAICGRKLRKPALLIRDWLAIGPKCAAQRGLLPTKARPVLPMLVELNSALRKAKQKADNELQMQLFDEVTV